MVLVIWLCIFIFVNLGMNLIFDLFFFNEVNIFFLLLLILEIIFKFVIMIFFIFYFLSIWKYNKLFKFLLK